MARIENHKFSIEEAFRECFYVVPDYQREYVWEEKEVLQLLEDINEQVEGGSSREYFIGTVLVSPTEEKNHYEVIDGQQRLTTFFLLLSALKYLFRGEPQHQSIGQLISTSYTDNEGETKSSLKLEPRYENAGEVIAKIVELEGEPGSVRNEIMAAAIPSFGSLENLVSAYAAIFGYLRDNYPDTKQLKRYWGYLANNVVFIQISTDVSSALKIFETINERGVGLNPMDLLKNLLFTQVDQMDFPKLKDEWKKITKALEKQKEKPLRFLRYFLMANYEIKNERHDATIREDEIYDWLVANADLCGYRERPFEFVRKIIRNVESYVAFNQGLGNDEKPSLAMETLKHLAGGAFSLHYVLLLAGTSLPKPLFDHFVVQLESFLFFYIFTKSPTKQLERSFSVWADELRSIAQGTSADEKRARLNQFIEERFQRNMKDKGRELHDALKRYNFNSMQVYRTRYLLAKLTQHVDLEFSGTKIKGSLDQYLRLEIEHILPNTPSSDLRAWWSVENPAMGYEDYKLRLGNLTLLEKPINVVAGNDFYVKKAAHYAKSANYLTRSLGALAQVGVDTSISRINKRLRSFEVWSAQSINERQDLLVELAPEIWRTRPFE